MTVDLSTVSTDDLHAEIARRKVAAQSKGKPMRHKTKAEWARARLADLRASKDEIKKDSGTGGDRGRRQRHDQYKALDEQIEKFTRLADFYERRGL